MRLQCTLLNFKAALFQGRLRRGKNIYLPSAILPSAPVERPAMKDNSTRTGTGTAALAILACVLWSTAFVAIKYGLRFAGPVSFAGARFTMAGLLLLPFCGHLRTFFRTVTANAWPVFVLSMFQTSLHYGLFYAGMTLVPGALAAIVIGSAPLITALTAHFLMPGERLNSAKVVSLIIGIIGVAVISLSRQPWQAAGLKEFSGIMLLLMSSFSAALGYIIVAKNRLRIPPLVLNSSQVFLGGITLLLVSLPLEGIPSEKPPVAFFLVLGWLALVSAAAISIWYYLLKVRKVKVSELNVWLFIIPINGAVLSWLLIPGESPTIFSVTGMICIAVSILTFFRASRKTEQT